MADSSTVIPATDLETAPCLVDRATALFNFGLATSIIHQGAWEESYSPMCHVISPETSALAVDPEVSQPFWSKSSGKPSKLVPNVSSEIPCIWLQTSSNPTVSGGDLISYKTDKRRPLPAKPLGKNWKRCLLLKIHRQQHMATRITNNQVNTTLPKETNKTPVTDPKEIEIYRLLDKELKIIILKMYNEM